MLWKQAVPTITSEQETKRELFLVEGKSAASTIRQAMNRQTQDVFALQGKVLNADTATSEAVEANPICSELFECLGCGIKQSCEPSSLQFSRIILLTDPDVDGAHARALLAVLFMRFLSPLVQDGRVFAVLPPLWRVISAHWPAPEYAWTDEELEALRDGRADSVQTTRFRGVAQFSPDECVALMLDPATRRHVRLSLGAQ